MQEKQIYKRNAVYSKLIDTPERKHKGDFIEVTQWVNGLGFDIRVSTYKEQNFNLTESELKLINELVNKLLTL